MATLPPVSTLFAAFLGINPMQHLLGANVLTALPAHNAATLTGHEYFPNLISGPFHHGLVIVFSAAAIMALVASAASALRGKRYMHDEPCGSGPAPDAAPDALSTTDESTHESDAAHAVA